MRKSDFLKDKGIVEHNAAGMYVVRDGNEYQLAVELDVDSVVYLDKTTDRHKVRAMVDNTLSEIKEIRARFGECFTE